MATPRGTRKPFTVVLCQRCHDAAHSSLLHLLGAAVRTCPHGMLVTSECWARETPCFTSSFGGGPRLALQPCTANRAPSAPTIWVGPITCDDDARAVCAWIADGDWDRSTLPVGLRVPRTAVHSPLLN